MPRFYFDLCGEQASTDQVGSDLGDLAAMRAEAARRLALLMSSLAHRAGAPLNLAMQVYTESGEPVLSLCVLEFEPLHAPASLASAEIYPTTDPGRQIRSFNAHAPAMRRRPRRH